MTSAPTNWGPAGAWFGTTLGSTCWIALSSLMLLVHGELIVALIVAACFLLPLAVALRAWARRGEATPDGALEAWFLIAWLASIVALAAVHASDTHAVIHLPGDRVWAMWMVLLLGGGLFWLAIRHQQRSGTDGVAGGLFDVLASWF